MANSKYTIDEDLLREKMLAYSVNFDPACLAALENEMAQVKTHTHIELPDRKSIIRLSIVASGILLLAVIIFFVTQAIQTNKNEEPQTKVETEPPVIETTQAQIPATHTVVVVDTLKAEPKKVDSISEPPQTKAVTNNQIPIAKQEEKSTKQVVVQQVDTVKKKIKADTSASKTTSQPAKKKKKRKNVLDATQDIRNAAPNSADDDVVIPDN